MFTPAMILKTWKRVNDRFGLIEEDAKARGNVKSKVLPKATPAQKTDVRIEQGLVKLRTIARGNMTDPGTAASVIQRRDTPAKSVPKYCKLLKGNDLKEAAEVLVPFRKTVKQRTVAVEGLQAIPYPPGEAG